VVVEVCAALVPPVEAGANDVVLAELAPVELSVDATAPLLFVAVKLRAWIVGPPDLICMVLWTGVITWCVTFGVVVVIGTDTEFWVPFLEAAPAVVAKAITETPNATAQAIERIGVWRMILSSWFGSPGWRSLIW
jgi:hypothetical protein